VLIRVLMFITGEERIALPSSAVQLLQPLQPLLQPNVLRCP
jgi:hypothetical protein